MNIRRTAVVALSVAVLGAVSASSARADEWNKLTYLTFSQDVAIPSKVLPAGTYTFRLVDSLSERHVVQIFNQTGTQLIATLLTVADQRLSAPDDTVIMFGEAAGNAPRPITRWFYPGDTVGEAFIYPKSSAAMSSMP
ncbi:MAG TPA: hypothetical protein VGY48_28045 [Vicinamibacterales bacterium]|jgi:hypothetical protein|nr:hypothetical protein [Vicinamibacterales bacterium]